MFRIEIRTLQSPDPNQPDQVIKWFCEVFGLAAEDEQNNIEEQLLKMFVEAAQQNQGISSSEITLDPPIARSTTIYHLNRLMETGLIIKQGRRYFLRATDMSKVIEEIEYDLEREMRKMLDLAAQFDKMMGNQPVMEQKEE